MIEYGNVQLPLLEGYDLTKSSQTVSFSNLTCDFTNHTSSDLPQKYQECQVYIKGVLKFTGYINGYSFKEMREKDEFLEVTFELLSPMAMATIRTQTASGNYSLKSLIEFVFEPLVDDGFIIQEISVTNRKINVNYVCETIEYIMSDLSASYNLWWFIDENKHIFVKDISSMLNEKPKHVYNDNYKINGLQYLKPTILSQEYANVVNFTNVRLYQMSRQNFDDEVNNPLLNEKNVNIKNGDVVEFNYPIDFKKDNILKSGESFALTQQFISGIYMSGIYTDDTTFSVYFQCDTISGIWIQSNNFDFDGSVETNKEFLFTRDAFFSNLVVGFKYNGSKIIKTITNIKSDSALIWNINKFYNDHGIEDKKGIISPTGIIEKTINMNEQWKTLPELMDIGATYIEKSSLSLDGQIEIGIDRDTFQIGDIIEIDKLLFNGKYIFTSIKENYKNNRSQYTAICKNVNIEDSYINLFRGKTKQENSERVFQTYITHYTQEGIKESHEVVR